MSSPSRVASRFMEAAPKSKIVPLELREAAITKVIEEAKAPAGVKKKVFKPNEKPPSNRLLSVLQPYQMAVFENANGVAFLSVRWHETWDHPSAELKVRAPNYSDAFGSGDDDLRDHWALNQNYGAFKVTEIDKALTEIFKTLKSDADSAPDLKELETEAKKVKTPTGWKREDGPGVMDSFMQQLNSLKTTYHVNLTSPEDDVTISVNFGWSNDMDYKTKKSKWTIDVSGHTNFKAPQGWLSFSRRGIGDSFYAGGIYGTNKLSDLNKMIPEEINRAKASIEKYQSSVQVKLNGTAFTLTSDRLEAIKASLKAGKPATLTPGGFGTGYYLSKKPFGGRYGVGVAPADVAEVFGVPKLYWQSFDHD